MLTELLSGYELTKATAGKLDFRNSDSKEKETTLKWSLAIFSLGESNFPLTLNFSIVQKPGLSNQAVLHA